VPSPVRAFVIGPYASKSVELTFPIGSYLEVDANRGSVAALSTLAIDLIGRGIFGTAMDEFAAKGFIPLGAGALAELIGFVERRCSGGALNLGTALAQATLLGTISASAEFLKCTATDKEVADAIAKLITKLYSKEAARRWIEAAAQTVADLVFIFERAPLLADLAFNTWLAPHEGFIRLEARP
jgi:hypothetical protein